MECGHLSRVKFVFSSPCQICLIMDFSVEAQTLGTKVDGV